MAETWGHPYDSPRAFGESKNVWVITASNPGMMTGPGTNTYVVGRQDLAVIDPGPDLVDHVEAIASFGAHKIRWILVTHTHPDHAPGARRLADLTGAELLGFEARDGFVPDETIGDSFSLELPEGVLRAIYTPGHASNHLCYLFEPDGVLFSGDHVMDGSTVVIAPPDGDMKDYLASLAFLRDSTLHLASIAPGHGNKIESPRDKLDEYITHRARREAAILESLHHRSRALIEEIVSDVYVDVPDFLHPIAKYSVWAHLRKLRGDHAVEFNQSSQVEGDLRSPGPTNEELGGTWYLSS